MYIIFLIEAATVMLSMGIHVSTVGNFIIDMAKNYKVFDVNKINVETQRRSLYSKLVLFIPGLNIKDALKTRKKVKKVAKYMIENKTQLVKEMNETEKRVYDKDKSFKNILNITGSEIKTFECMYGTVNYKMYNDLEIEIINTTGLMFMISDTGIKKLILDEIKSEYLLKNQKVSKKVMIDALANDNSIKVKIKNRYK